MNYKIIESTDGIIVQTDEGFVEVKGNDIKDILDKENYIECLQKETKKLETELQKNSLSLEISIKSMMKKNYGTKLFLMFAQPLTIIFGIIFFLIFRMPEISLSINGESFYNVINFITQTRAILTGALIAMASFLSIAAKAIVNRYKSNVNHIKLQEFKDLIIKTQEELNIIEGFIKTPRPDLTEKNVAKKPGSISIPLRTEYSLKNEADEAMVRRYRR